MDIPSRTPEGETNLCPLCGKRVVITPSDTAGDAPCPHCGTLLWFVVIDTGRVLFRRRFASSQFLLEDHGAGHGGATAGIGPPADFAVGDCVRLKEGAIDSFAGEVSQIDRSTGRVTFVINLVDRLTPVEVESWQIESV